MPICAWLLAMLPGRLVGWRSLVGGFAGTSRLLQLSMTRSNPQITGVTNVGIHSRTGREKIFAQHIAHVLNDENQRKYIQVRHRAHPLATLRPHNQQPTPKPKHSASGAEAHHDICAEQIPDRPFKVPRAQGVSADSHLDPFLPSRQPKKQIPHPSPLSFAGHSLAAVPEQPR